MQQPIVEQLDCNTWRPAGSARLVDAQVARLGHRVLPEHEGAADPAAAVAARAADAGGLPGVHIVQGTADEGPADARQMGATEPIPRVAIEPDGDAPSWWPGPPPPKPKRRDERSLAPGLHRKTVLRLADPINTITLAELRWREGFEALPRRRVATWLVVLGYLLALATILTALLLEGLQEVAERHSAPPETSKTLSATTVAVPVPGGGGR